MKALASIDAILIRATYYADMSSAVLQGLAMDTASAQAINRAVASDVEHCDCPEGYVGLSCEVNDFLPHC